MFKHIAMKQAQSLVGGAVINGGPLYKCYSKSGKVYWDSKPNAAGCLNWSTQQIETGSGKGSGQRK